jgi:hypothetical protein
VFKTGYSYMLLFQWFKRAVSNVTSVSNALREVTPEPGPPGRDRPYGLSFTTAFISVVFYWIHWIQIQNNERNRCAAGTSVYPVACIQCFFDWIHWIQLIGPQSTLAAHMQTDAGIELKPVRWARLPSYHRPSTPWPAPSRNRPTRAPPYRTVFFGRRPARPPA